MASRGLTPFWDRLLVATNLAEHILGHVDGDLGGHRQSDGIAGPAINLNQLAVHADAQLGKIGVFPQLANEDVLQIADQVIDSH